jgi:DNA-binding NarL/FixJ family response regulator
MSARILIVDDYQVARRTIRSLLTWHAMHVCGEAEDGRQAVEKVKQLHPDLVLLDINMPVMNGVQAAYEIRRIAPSTKIIFFTIHDSPDTMAAARLIGVDEFVPKAAAGTQLIPTVKRLLETEH